MDVLNSLAQRIVNGAGTTHGTLSQLNTTNSPLYGALNKFLTNNEPAPGAGKDKNNPNSVLSNGHINNVSSYAQTLLGADRFTP